MIQLADEDAATVVDILKRVAAFFEGFTDDRPGTYAAPNPAYDALVAPDAEVRKGQATRFRAIATELGVQLTRDADRRAQ
jgi:hypothetical protein